MRVLVCPHALTVGGSQINAIELAAAVRDLGHDVLVFGPDGPLVDRLHALGLRHVPSPRPRMRPSPSIIEALVTTVRAEEVDVLHGHEWPPALECYIAGTVLSRRPSVGTVMSMAVAPFIPSGMPLVVGTEHIRRVEQSRRRGRVTLIEPPVDTGRAGSPVQVDEFRKAHGLVGAELNVVVVSRLARELKLEGLLEAVEAVGRLAECLPVRLVVVGTGPALPEVAAAAHAVNDRVGRSVIVLTGELLDPWPAYELADVAIGMGGSALRAMSSERPTVVQGEAGFWEVVSPTTVEQFLVGGWYGRGDGSPGVDRLATLLRDLLCDAALRREVGAFGRHLVEERFSLSRAAVLQAQVYAAALAAPRVHRGVAVDSVRAAVRFSRYEVARRWQRRSGRAATDDFNARVDLPAGPGAGSGFGRPLAGEHSKVDASLDTGRTSADRP